MVRGLASLGFWRGLLWVLEMRSPHEWIIKALLQKSISKGRLLPLYHRLQRTHGRLREFHPKARSEYAAKLYADLLPWSSLRGANMVEIGTGWVPVLPLILHVMGAGRIDTYDLSRHLQKGLTVASLPLLRQCLPDVARRTGLNVEKLEGGLQELIVKATTADRILAEANISYHAPANASATRHKDKSIDIVYSNLVLEHVTPRALDKILCESYRILRDGGFCWHNIDFSDHYAATQPHLSPINFLRYSDSFWSLVGQNDILYQNRMRRSQYVERFVAAGFAVVACVDHLSERVVAELKQGFRVSAEFRNLDERDLAVTASRFVLRKQGK